MEEPFLHEPVLVEEVVRHLHPPFGGVYVDGTIGGGGHAARIARRLGPHGTIVGVDRDPSALRAAGVRLRDFLGRLELVHDTFDHVPAILAELGIDQVDICLLDLGVSSPQLDHPERGFSYHQEGPLDMRMDPREEWTAARLVQESSEEDLVRILREYGEERYARRIAAALVRERRRRQFGSTTDLAEVVAEAVPAPARREGHPARRVFQALRIAVNRELEILADGLPALWSILSVGGRIGVITFHSLEDRMVKRFFQDKTKACICPPEWPICRCGGEPEAEPVTRGAVVAGEEELRTNRRARSAKLRVVRKVRGSRERGHGIG